MQSVLFFIYPNGLEQVIACQIPIHSYSCPQKGCFFRNKSRFTHFQ